MYYYLNCGLLDLHYFVEHEKYEVKNVCGRRGEEEVRGRDVCGRRGEEEEVRGRDVCGRRGE